MPKTLRVDDFSDIEISLRTKNVPNPQDAYNELINVLRMRCNIDKHDINEKKYEHEKQGESEIIRSEIRAYKPLDKFSKLYFKIQVYIDMRPSKSEEYDYVGDLEVTGKGRVRTEYPQESWLQRSILWHAFRTFYEKLIYGDVKEVYMDKCDKYMRYIRDELKSYFDMLPTIQ